MTIKFKKNQLALVFPILLAACTGKGSFDSNVVEKNIDIQPNINTNENLDNGSTESVSADNAKESMLGKELGLVRRNQQDFVLRNGKTIEDVIIINDIVNGEQSYKASRMADAPLKQNDIVERSNNLFKPKDGYSHIDFGIENMKNSLSSVENDDGNLIYESVDSPFKAYYQGDLSSQSLPTAPEVMYEGEWAFITDAKSFRNSLDVVSSKYYVNTFKAGDYFSANSNNEENATHSSRFTVNFNDKTLVGELGRTLDGNYVVRYNIIDGEIVGNRFTGKAVPTVNDRQKEQYFYADSDSVEGGFYGDNAEELAGSFFANDGSLFAVFGAKTNASIANLSPEDISEAFKIKIDDNTINASAMANFIGISKLVVDGKAVPLVKSKSFTSATLNPETDNKVDVHYTFLDNVSFGSFSHTSSEDQNNTSAIDEASLSERSKSHIAVVRQVIDTYTGTESNLFYELYNAGADDDDFNRLRFAIDVVLKNDSTKLDDTQKSKLEYVRNEIFEYMTDELKKKIVKELNDDNDRATSNPTLDTASSEEERNRIFEEGHYYSNDEDGVKLLYGELYSEKTNEYYPYSEFKSDLASIKERVASELNARERDMSLFSKLEENIAEKIALVQKPTNSSLGNYLFLQGLKTPVDKMPTAQSFEYRGNWYGYFDGRTQVSEGNQANGATTERRVRSDALSTAPTERKAFFLANFADKSLNGYLSDNALPDDRTFDNLKSEDRNIIIEASIDRNTFNGKAYTNGSGIVLEKGTNGNTATPRMVFNSDGADVKGAFFGNEAQALGGKIHYENSSTKEKAEIVFGAEKVK
ncbi:transferrin-binding protein-like solute binding protein [Otariodibacter oris]|uniref:Transferrin binding protein n=1 Tax=Otariodibacter oris TaxID=1032623 RepID=A0A420XJD9_9PAST|nr:transferrin-binding protein-like solute binding protein [Otariodibacter oris]QGM80583.1 hypothetical protein A6A10_03800 [Otariodibacter oris]RKR77261.1 transferrin binding protein [Otariodibacter oris]